MKKILTGIFAGILITLVIAMPVLASYYASLTVVEANSNSYDELAMLVACDVDFLATEGYITSTGLDTRVEAAGTAIPHMMVDDQIMFCNDVTADGALNLQFTTGNTALSNFDVIVGDGGYVTVSDHANLELADDFEVEFDGYVDTSVDTDPTVDYTNTSYESATTSHTVDLPGTISQGDLLIMLFGIRDAAAGIATPGGWTEIFNDENAGRTLSVSVFYKVAGASESSPVTVTTTQSDPSAHQTFCISGYYGVPEASASADGTGNPNSASLSPTWNTAGDTLWLSLFVARDGTSSSISSAPTNYADDLFVEEPGTFTSAGSSTRSLEASSENPGAYTMSDNQDGWVAVTVGVRGSHPLVEKEDAFALYVDGGDINAKIFGGTERTVSTTQSPGEYVVNAWADTTNLGIDIDASTEDSTALSGVSVVDNANDFILTPIYWDYYNHTTSSTLRIDYSPDSIITGTTLPNETSPGTYDGTITWGSNPAGVTITLGALISDFQPVPAGGEGDFGSTQDVAGTNVQPGWTTDPTGLSSHPFYPLVSTANTLTDIPINVLWIIGATMVILAAMIVGFKYIPHHVITVLIGGGLYAYFWHQGIFPFWGVFIFAAGGLAVVISERVQSY